MNTNERWSPRKLEKPFAILAVCALAFLGFGATCTPGGGGGNSGDEAAAINFQLRVENSDSFAIKPYTIQVEWHGELVSGTGSVGNANPFTITQSYNGTTDTSGDYVVKKIATNQRPGTWKLRVTADLGGWSTTCDQTFQAGALTSANFTHSKNGCMLGINFP